MPFLRESRSEDRGCPSWAKSWELKPKGCAFYYKIAFSQSSNVQWAASRYLDYGEKSIIFAFKGVETGVCKHTASGRTLPQYFLKVSTATRSAKIRGKQTRLEENEWSPKTSWNECCAKHLVKSFYPVLLSRSYWWHGRGFQSKWIHCFFFLD